MARNEDLENEELEDRGDLFDPEEDEDQDEEEQEEDQDENDEDQDEEEDTEEEEQEEETSKKKDIKIPKSRLDEVIQQREDAKERNLWLEEQLSILIKQSQKETSKEVEVPISTYDFEKAEEDYVSLIIEGEIAKASKLRAEIDKERKTELLNLIKNVETNVTVKAKAESLALSETDKFNSYIDKLEEQYPFLNDKSNDYNEEAVDTVNTLLAGYVAAGKTKTEGLKLAVAKVVPMYIKSQPEKKSLGNKRTVDAGKKAAKAANSQPTKVKSTTNTPVDSSKINISKMSDRDFSKLTAKEKSILRGD